MEDGVLCSTLDLVIVHTWMVDVQRLCRRHQQGQQLASAKQAVGMQQHTLQSMRGSRMQKLEALLAQMLRGVPVVGMARVARTCCGACRALLATIAPDWLASLPACVWLATCPAGTRSSFNL
ncbi:unnamed protein product [Effrenium voratum]|nr:unnamed protein product [Effrenium voratum]